MISILIKLSLLPSYLWDMIWAPFYKRAMKHCGRGVYLRPMSSDIKGLWNLSIGDGTSIPKGSTFYCTEAPLTIGNKVVFGPRPTIITGDHRIDIIGKHIIDVTVAEKWMEDPRAQESKSPSDPALLNGEALKPLNHKINPFDLPVVIEDGVWVGANVTILKGVTIGRGSVVAAGSVVTKSCEPYSIIGGIPAKLIKMRFTEEDIKEHDRLICTR